ncbi:MAG: LPXTG cell wall anchor domain-containing protein [Microthrixaceae bacterium]
MRTTLRSSVAAIALAFLAVLAFSSVAGAQEGNGSYVGGEVQSKTALKSSPPVQAEVEANSLAFTGSDSTTIALVGVVAVLAGGSLLVVRRRSNVH